MKSNELRIGNYISPLGIGITKVEGFCIWDNIIQSDNFAERDIVDFNPIPLTEEWLLKFGFELINNEFYRSRNLELCLYWTANKNKIIPEYNEKRLVTGYDFKYVHQLQNLYFALTGQELTLKK